MVVIIMRHLEVMVLVVVVVMLMMERVMVMIVLEVVVVMVIGNGDSGGDEGLDDASGGIGGDPQLHSGRKQYEDLNSFVQVVWEQDLHVEMRNGLRERTFI